MKSSAEALKNKIITTSERIAASESALSSASFDFYIDVGRGWFNEIHKELSDIPVYADYVYKITKPNVSSYKINEAIQVWTNAFHQFYDRNENTAEKEAIKYLNRVWEASDHRSSYLVVASALAISGNGDSIIRLVKKNHTVEEFKRDTYDFRRYNKERSAACRVNYVDQFRTLGGPIAGYLQPYAAANFTMMCEIIENESNHKKLSKHKIGSIFNEGFEAFLYERLKGPARKEWLKKFAKHHS